MCSDLWIIFYLFIAFQLLRHCVFAALCIFRYTSKLCKNNNRIPRFKRKCLGYDPVRHECHMYHKDCLIVTIVTVRVLVKKSLHPQHITYLFFVATVSYYVVHGRWNKTRTIGLRFHNINGRYRRAYRHFEVELLLDGIGARNNYSTSRTTNIVLSSDESQFILPFRRSCTSS